MIVKNKCIRSFLPLIILTLLMNSCKKDIPACAGNCATISISGNIYVKTTGTPIANVPVEILWLKRGLCIGCKFYEVPSGKTGQDGKFNFSVTFDSTFFKDYVLRVQIPPDSNYLTYPYRNDPKIVNQYFDDFNSPALQNIKFESYPKTFLTIKLRRTLSDNFNSFSVAHGFTNEFTYSDYSIYQPQSARDTTLIVPTSSDIYTKVYWNKSIGGQINLYSDSLICTKNGSNTFTINY